MYPEAKPYFFPTEGGGGGVLASGPPIKNILKSKFIIDSKYLD